MPGMPKAKARRALDLLKAAEVLAFRISHTYVHCQTPANDPVWADMEAASLASLRAYDSLETLCEVLHGKAGIAWESWYPDPPDDQLGPEPAPWSELLPLARQLALDTYAAMPAIHRQKPFWRLPPCAEWNAAISAMILLFRGVRKLVPDDHGDSLAHVLPAGGEEALAEFALGAKSEANAMPGARSYVVLGLGNPAWTTRPEHALAIPPDWPKYASGLFSPLTPSGFTLRGAALLDAARDNSNCMAASELPEEWSFIFSIGPWAEDSELALSSGNATITIKAPLKLVYPTKEEIERFALAVEGEPALPQ